MVTTSHYPSMFICLLLLSSLDIPKLLIHCHRIWFLDLVPCWGCFLWIHCRRKKGATLAMQPTQHSPSKQGYDGRYCPLITVGVRFNWSVPVGRQSKGILSVRFIEVCFLHIKINYLCPQIGLPQITFPEMFN